MKKLTNEQRDELSYTDIAYLVLKDSKGGMKVPALFKKVCELLSYGDEFYMDKIGDFYTDINTDKRFVSVEDGVWDIRDRHSVVIEAYDETEDDDEPIEETDPEKMGEDTEGESDDDVDDEINLDADLDDLDDLDDDLDSLTIVTEDELEE